MHQQQQGKQQGKQRERLGARQPPKRAALLLLALLAALAVFLLCTRALLAGRVHTVPLPWVHSSYLKGPISRSRPADVGTGPVRRLRFPILWAAPFYAHSGELGSAALLLPISCFTCSLLCAQARFRGIIRQLLRLSLPATCCAAGYGAEAISYVAALLENKLIHPDDL